MLGFGIPPCCQQLRGAPTPHPQAPDTRSMLPLRPDRRPTAAFTRRLRLAAEIADSYGCEDRPRPCLLTCPRGRAPGSPPVTSPTAAPPRRGCDRPRALTSTVPPGLSIGGTPPAPPPFLVTDFHIMFHIKRNAKYNNHHTGRNSAGPSRTIGSLL